MGAQSPLTPDAARPSASPTPARLAARELVTPPDGFVTIQGSALAATGTSLAGAKVRLRDARFGRIVDAQSASSSGAFAFRGVDPGVYVVELVGESENVLAASSIMSVTAGQTASTSVRLPFRVAPFGGVFGDSAPSAAVIAAEAAAAGVLTTTSTQPVSPEQ